MVCKIILYCLYSSIKRLHRFSESTVLHLFQLIYGADSIVEKVEYDTDIYLSTSTPSLAEDRGLEPRSAIKRGGFQIRCLAN